MGILSQFIINSLCTSIKKYVKSQRIKLRRKKKKPLCGVLVTSKKLTYIQVALSGVYVMRYRPICAIDRSRCAISGSVVCATIDSSH